MLDTTYILINWHPIFNIIIIKWPEVEKEFINNEINNIVVQINGKKRSIITTNTEMDEKTILKKIQEDRLVEKYIDGKKILKTIYVKNKIINIII